MPITLAGIRTAQGTPPHPADDFREDQPRVVKNADRIHGLGAEDDQWIDDQRREQFVRPLPRLCRNEQERRHEDRCRSGEGQRESPVPMTEAVDHHPRGEWLRDPGETEQEALTFVAMGDRPCVDDHEDERGGQSNGQRHEVPHRKAEKKQDERDVGHDLEEQRSGGLVEDERVRHDRRCRQGECGKRKGRRFFPLAPQ